MLILQVNPPQRYFVPWDLMKPPTAGKYHARHLALARHYVPWYFF